MAIKLKNNKNNKYIVNIIISMVILIGSMGLVLTYPKIKQDGNKFVNDVFEYESSVVIENIRRSTYGLYYKIKNENSTEYISPSDLMLEKKEIITNENNTENENIEIDTTKTFNTDIENYYNYLDKSLQNLDYYAIDKETNKVIKSSNINPKNFLENSENLSKQLEEKYRFYIVLDFDNNGKMEMKKTNATNRPLIYNELNLITEGNDLNYYFKDFKFKPIKNMQYIYAIPNELAYIDEISDSINNNIYYSYQRASYLYVNIAVAFIVFMGVLIPYKESKNLIGFNKIIKIPKDIILIILFLAIVYIYSMGETSIIPNTISNNLVTFTQMQLTQDVKNILTSIINITYWSVGFLIIFIGCIVIKHILKEGILNCFKNDTFIIKVFKNINKTTKNIYKWCTSVELSKNNNKKILTILFINMIILTIMCCMWFFGIIAVVIYTVILAIIIKKNYAKVMNDYNKLLNITKQIASGNLETNTSEDVGVFNVLKDELTNIQKGFKKAVDEEVKSQKMKTELISNVSHDLKTPLTSIITYVDLLKDENLDEEKRKLYIDTLDRKSERLKVLIEDLFEVSKANSGNVNLNIIDVDVVSLMKQTLLEVDDKFDNMSLVVRKNMPSEKIMLKLDSQRTFRVFENLLVNITKYAMLGSRVYIDIVDKSDIVEISLRNMAADEINFNVDELVERFVRGDKSRNTEGSGLGLAIAKSFVELQGGEFEVSVDGDLFKVIIRFKK